MSELKNFLLEERQALLERREEYIESLNILEGRLTEIDLIAEAMGCDFKTTLEEKL